MEKINNRNSNPSARVPNETSMAKTLREIIHDEHEETEIPVKLSLMALMADDYELEEEEEEQEQEQEQEEDGKEVVNSLENDGEFASMCCVCKVRSKGAAFIPCGHTFCRFCSREVWVSRGNCPLCNGFILDILDIF